MKYYKLQLKDFDLIAELSKIIGEELLHETRISSQLCSTTWTRSYGFVSVGYTHENYLMEYPPIDKKNIFINTVYSLYGAIVNYVISDGSGHIYLIVDIAESLALSDEILLKKWLDDSECWDLEVLLMSFTL